MDASLSASTSSNVSPLSDEWLQAFVRELENDDLVGIVLGGSYARGDASAYSDVDFACYVHNAGAMPGVRRLEYRDGRLLSIGVKVVADVRRDLWRPELAYKLVPGVRVMRILLDKDGSLTALQNEAKSFRWEMIQEEANSVVSENMLWDAEMMHKILNALLQNDESAQALYAFKMLNLLTHTMAIHYQTLITTDRTYYQQVQEAVGLETVWTRYHKMVAGLAPLPPGMPEVRARCIAILSLYREMYKLTRPILRSEHLAVVEQCVTLIEHTQVMF